MRLPTALPLALGLALALAGCSTVRNSAVNPFNWFGSSRSTAVVTVPNGAAAVQDDRPLVAQVTRLELKRAEGGAILSVAGLPPTQGWWDAVLVPDQPGEVAENGVLSYRLLAKPPPLATRSSTAQSRELTVARFLSNETLAGVKTVVVRGAGNQMSTSRR